MSLLSIYRENVTLHPGSTYATTDATSPNLSSPPLRRDFSIVVVVISTFLCCGLLGVLIAFSLTRRCNRQAAGTAATSIPSESESTELQPLGFPEYAEPDPRISEDPMGLPSLGAPPTVDYNTEASTDFDFN